MVVHSETISFVIDPVPVIDISINMDELALTVGSVVFPLAFVLSTIWPLLNTVAVSEAADPFSVEGRSRLELVGLSFLPLGVWIVLS